MSVVNKTLKFGHPFLDFRVFLIAIWAHLGLPRPTEVQLDLANTMQYGTHRDVVEAFRGVGKSWITCAYVCWCLLLDPNYKVEIISAGEDLAIQNATFIKQLIDNVDFLQHLKARTGQRNSNLNFDVGPAKSSRDPSVKAVGILGQITGSRADLIIADDIEIPKNSDSQGQRDKIRQLVTEFESILKPEGGRILYLGTPQLMDSLYTKLPDNYRVYVWPAEYPSLERLELDRDKLAQYIIDGVLIDGHQEGEPVEPTRFPRSVLDEKRLGMGVSNYNLQFLLDTSSSDANRYPLKLRDLVIMDLDRDEGHDKVYYASSSDQEYKDLNVVGLTGDRFYKPLRLSPNLSKWERILLIIDPSGRGKDETSYAIIKQLNSQLFVHEWAGLRGGYDDEVLTFLAGRAEAHRITDCAIEVNFGDGMFNKLFQPFLNKNRQGRAVAEEIHNSSQKEKRIIDTLEPVMNQHRLIFDRRVVEDDYDSVKDYPIDTAYRYRGFYQLTHITKDKHSLGQDDRIDVLAMGVNYLLDHMDLNQRDHAESLEMARHLKEMKHWVDLNGNGSHQKHLQQPAQWGIQRI